VNEPVVVRLGIESTLETRFYVAVEDTLPPGFEADKDSLEACLNDSVKSYSIRGDKVTFFIDALQEEMELEFTVIPTMVGSVVAPPARLFPMYTPDDVVCSEALELTVREAAQEPVASDPAALNDKQQTAGNSSNGSSAPSDRPAPSKAVPKLPPVKEPAEIIALPDMAITGVRRSDQASAGVSVVFIADISFSGFREDFVCAISAYVDGMPVKAEKVKLSLTSTVFSFDFSWQVTPGTHMVRIVADPDDIVEESDEANNIFMETFHIAAPQTASRPQSSAWQAGLLALDGLISFVATVGLYRPMRAFWGRRKARKATRD
jgi:hypothetical protein